jgi:shikimate dehydrogenase
MRLRVGLIGYPTSHSRSPGMQQAALDIANIAACYELWSTPPSDLVSCVAMLREPDILGANVTIPYKVAVMPLLDRIAPSAQDVGAVNTVVKQDGYLVGHNTDGEGLAAALNERGYSQLSHAVVLGSGGAARAALVSLRICGAATVTLLARNFAAATMLASTVNGMSCSVAQLPENDLLPGDIIPMLASADMIINATPVGMAHQPGMPLPATAFDYLPSHALVVDLITAQTEWQKAAQVRGLATMDGMSMLLHQGALAFTLWTGLAAPLEAMRTGLYNSHPGSSCYK